MPDFRVDRRIVSNGVRIDVTHHEMNDDDVQINIHPAKETFPRITLFIGLKAAAELGRALLEAAEVADADAS